MRRHRHRWPLADRAPDEPIGQMSAEEHYVRFHQVKALTDDKLDRFGEWFDMALTIAEQVAEPITPTVPEKCFGWPVGDPRNFLYGYVLSSMANGADSEAIEARIRLLAVGYIVGREIERAKRTEEPES